MVKQIIILFCLLLPGVINGASGPYGTFFEAGGGVTVNKGNTDKLGVNGSLDFKKVTPVLKLLISLNQYYNETKGVKNVNKGDLTVKCDYDITLNEQLFIFFIPSYNEFQDLKLRTQTGTGIKHTFYKNSTMDYSVSAAVLYETKEYLKNKEKGYLGRLSVRPKIKINFNKNVFFLVFFYQPQITNFNDYRILGTATVKFFITEHLFFEVNVKDEYNNIVPDDIMRNDFTSYSGIKIKF